EFADMVAQAGLTFLGPNSEAMGLLGDKIMAKELADRSDVPILPWSKREIVDVADARTIAAEIGYPVIVKAAHAGGGRGIRFVMTPDDLESQFTAAREETKRITGDEIVFIERLVVTGRHLEVQCLCDRHGTVYTFGVRDCSVQRRNQKIIEETPPPGMSSEEIEEIEASAARLMKAASYESAGTVEFLYDVDRGEYYFMEVNTRLQVEHPITELLYDVDMVKGQIAVAFGAKLDDLKKAPRGVVLEARLNAEDPDRDFTPSPGYVRHFRTPAGPGVRVDSGIAAGSTIPSLFDSMVAKVIAHGRDRREAIARLRRALYETRIAIDGGTTNKAFLLKLLQQPEIVAGGVHTKYVEALLAKEATKAAGAPDVALVAAAIELYASSQDDEIALFRRQIANLGYPRSRPDSGGRDVSLIFDGNTYAFTVRQVSAYRFHLSLDGTEITADYIRSPGESRLSYAGKRYAIQTISRGDSLQVEVDGIPVVLGLEAGGSVSAPSPSVVLGIAVQPGDTVEKGARLLSLEAMKMEMIIEAPASGVVKEVLVAAGQQVAAGEPLVLLDTSGEEEQADADAAGEPVAFHTVSGTPEAVWHALRESLHATFAGYDASSNPHAEFHEMARLADQHPTLRDSFFEALYAAIETTVAVDSLFSDERLVSEQFARPVTWQELIYIYFRYEMHDSESLPTQFTETLESVLNRYPGGTDNEGHWSAFYHLQRSQSRRDQKLDLVRAAIFTLESLSVPSGRSQGLLRLLDEIIRLNQIRMPSLADAALHARYHLYEQNKVTTLRRQRSARIQERLRRVITLEPGSEERRALEQRIVDASPYIVYELIDAYAADGPNSKERALELLGRHYVRDRELESVEVVKTGPAPFVRATADGITTLVFVSPTPEALRPEAVASSVAATTGSSKSVTATDVEVIVLARAPNNEEPGPIIDSFAAGDYAAGLLSVGVYQKQRRYSYKSFRNESGQWIEDEQRAEFSPLFYRELRVARLANFSISVLYHSDSVFLVSAKAKENPKDERLYALGTASESEPEIGPDGQIERISEFDEVFMEAVFKMRSEQARRRRRLFWNRIVVHVRGLIRLTADQMQGYGERIVPRTRDLGLEKVVIFTRRKRWSEDRIRDLELLFLNISEDQFTLRSRTPSDEPYQPMDRYVSSVVRSRQRKNVYPYEVIKMITYTGYPVSLNVPRGDFEEFDLGEPVGSIAAPPISVKGREYGRNDSNVVFGIIRNQDPGTGHSLFRVLVLSDATKDMGSLAEAECRRVIAALDLATERGLPVEWLPISSGARIDMESGTENLDWTAAVVRRIVEFTQAGGEINIIVSGINVGAQSYWNAEATMLMHTRGLLIMTDDASMLLTGKKALDFSGSVSADTNVEIGGAERIMGPNGQAQLYVSNLAEAYEVLFRHYRYTYVAPGKERPKAIATSDPADRNVGLTPYQDRYGQGFARIADIFSAEHNPERKKPFDMRQLMHA
ncbi:MAG: biotin/lipoyl-containing protein, partial [Spirochaetales bacterium]